MSSSANPFFSIIVPVYNVEPYLGECLDSVLAQTFGDFECLCTDDGSRDGSGALLDAYARRDPRFRITHQPNAGVSSARNRALDRTCGNWVWFVDGDDAIHERALEVLCNQMERFPTAQAITFRSALQRWEAMFSSASHIEVHCSYETLCRFLISASFLLFQRSMIGSLRFPTYCVGEDGLFSLRYYDSIVRWVETDFPLYYYRARHGSAMRSPPSECFVLDWNRMLYERVCLLAPRVEITTGGAVDYLRREVLPLAWHSRDFGLFRLPGGASRRLLPSWLRLVGALNAAVPLPLHRRLVYYLLAETRSPFLAKLLVAFPVYARIWLGGKRRALCALLRH